MADQKRKNSPQEGQSAGRSLNSNLFMEGLADFIQTSLSCDQRSTVMKDGQCSSFEAQICNSQDQIREPMSVENVVQQREVSSSKPSPSSLLNHNVVGPLLLQALDGFLLIISSDGIIEFVSDNIHHYLNYSVEDLMGKSVYRFLHPISHQFFGGCLESLASKTPLDIINNRNFSHEAKFRINTADEFLKDLDDSNFLRTRLQFFHQKSRRMSRDYDFSPSSPDNENQSYLVCIAQRIGVSINERNASSALNLDQCQFTTKQDLQGKILNCDSSSLRAYLKTVPGFLTIRDFVGKNVLEFCHPYDKDRLRQHHEEVVKNGTNMSGVYRFQILKGKYVFVQTKSKLFKNPMNNKPEFIMSTHSIVRMCDSDAELKGSAEKGLMQAIIGPTLPNHRDSFWMSSLSEGSSIPTSPASLSSWKDKCHLPNSSSMLLPLPDAGDNDIGLQWNHNHPPFSRSYSAVAPRYKDSRPPSVASNQSPQHKNTSGVKRPYKRKHSSPSSDSRNKGIFYEGSQQEDLIMTNRLSKRPSPLSISSFSLEEKHRKKSSTWDLTPQSAGVLPPLQALQQLQVSSSNVSAFKPETSLHNSPAINDHSMLSVFSPLPESCKFFPPGRILSNKGEGLRALLTASDEDDFKSDYEMNPIKHLGSSSSLLIPSSSNPLDRYKESANCFNRSPPQEPQSTTLLGENPNSPKELQNNKRGQSPGRCNLLMNLLTGATDDEDEDPMKVNDNKSRTSMRILAKLETLQSLPDTSARLTIHSERSEVESTSENNTLLKALLKSNSEGERPTKKADILSKLLSDTSDDVFIHPTTEISSTVGNDSDGIKLFLTSSNQRQPIEISISQKGPLFNNSTGISSMENALYLNGMGVMSGPPLLRRNISCTSTIPAITSSLMTAPQPNSPSSLLSVASSSLSFLISCSNGTIASNSSLTDNVAGHVGDKRPATSGNCKLLKELLSNHPAPQNIVNPCRISALPMAAPQTIGIKKLQIFNQNVKPSAESVSQEANKTIVSDDSESQMSSRQVSMQEESQGNDLSGFLEDGDLDLESILSSMTSASFDLPMAEDIEPLMMSQIEHAIMTADLSTIEIDQLINNSDCKDGLKPKQDGFMHDKMAITEIQNELMKIGSSKSGYLIKTSDGEISSKNLSANVPAVIPQVKNQSMDVCVARTSLMTVAHKGPEEPVMTTCGGVLRRRSVDPQMQASREMFAENSLRHFKDMMNVSIAPNVIAPRTSVPMTLGQLLNRSSRATSEHKESANQGTSKTSGEPVSSQAPSTSQDSALPRSPLLPPAAPLINRRGSSLPIGVVPGSLQALHQHHSFSQVNFNQNCHPSVLPTSSSIVSFKSVSESEDGKAPTVLYNATLSPASANKKLLLGNKESSQRMFARQSSVHLEGGKVLTNGAGIPMDDCIQSPPSLPLSHPSPSSSSFPVSSSMSVHSLKPTYSSSMNAKLALKGVLQGRSQNNQSSNQVVASAKISDVLKIPKKLDDQPKLLLQQPQVCLKSVVDGGRPEDSLGMNNSIAPYAFQSISSDLDDLEVIIAQEEKESRQFESQISNSTAPRQVNSAKVGYITVGSAGQQAGNHHNAHPSFGNINDESVASQFTKSQEAGHKIVFLGEQDSKLFHVQVGGQFIKQQLVPQQIQQPQQLFVRQHQISQPNILLHQTPLSNLPQHLIFGQVCQQPKPKSHILPVHVSPLKVANFTQQQHVMNQQEHNLQQIHQQFGSNVNHFHQVQLQPQQFQVSKNQQAIIFQQECQQPSSHFVIHQQDIQSQTLNDSNKQIVVDNTSRLQSRRMTSKCEQTTYGASQPVNSTPPLFGADVSDIGNLEDDEIYQLISALSNEESAFCLSQLSEEAINWADNNAMQVTSDKSKESMLDINKVFNKDMNIQFSHSESQARIHKNISLQSTNAGRYVNYLSPSHNDSDFVSKPTTQDNAILDSLIFQSNVFSNESTKHRRSDQDDLSQPKRHAMLEKLLAE